MSSSTTSVLPANPFSRWKSTINLDKNHTVVSNLPDELATLIFSKMAIEKVSEIMENTQTLMDRYSLGRNLLSAKSSLTGAELEKFQSLLLTEGQDPVHKEDQMPQSRMAFITQLVFSAYQYWTGNGSNRGRWAELLADKPMYLRELRQLDLSDSTNITDADLIALTKCCDKLTKLILPGAFPSEEVMAILRENCPQAAIYPSAMTEDEWVHPTEFMAKLPPPPKEVKDFINGPRPIWPGKTASQAHMVVPRVNKIVRTVWGRDQIVPWTLKNINELEKAMGGVGCRYIWSVILEPGRYKPSKVGFEWVVFTKNVLPNTFNIGNSCREQVVKHWGYEFPDLLDATTCMLWENCRSGDRIYHDNFTNCKDYILGNHLVAGGFTMDGVCADWGRDYFGNLGAGGIRKFKV